MAAWFMGYIIAARMPPAKDWVQRYGGDTASYVAHRDRIYVRSYPEDALQEKSQKRAVKNYRSRLGRRGMARFEIVARDTDRNLIRSLAKRLAEDGPEAERIRAADSRTMADELPGKGRDIGRVAPLTAGRRRSGIQPPKRTWTQGRSMTTGFLWGRAGRR
jgi:hypothetical protein